MVRVDIVARVLAAGGRNFGSAGEDCAGNDENPIPSFWAIGRKVFELDPLIL